MGNALGYIKVEKPSITIKEEAGKFDYFLTPGCHCMPVWCIGSNIPGDISLYVQQLTVRCETKTKDNVFVTIVASVQYRPFADKAADGYYKLSNIKEQIQAHVFDVVRASVPSIELDSVFQQKNEIAKSVEGELQKAMSMYGYEIVGMLIVDIMIDERMKKSLREKSAARRANRAKEVGEVESKYYSAQGRMWEREAIVDGLKESVLGFSSNIPGISTKDAIGAILLTHYFDTMDNIAASSKSACVFVPHGAGAVKDFAAQMHRIN